MTEDLMNTSPQSDVRLALTAYEAARSLGICRRTLHTLTQSGQIRCLRVGRRLLYRPETLRAWLEAQEGHVSDLQHMEPKKE